MTREQTQMCVDALETHIDMLIDSKREEDGSTRKEIDEQIELAFGAKLELMRTLGDTK